MTNGEREVGQARRKNKNRCKRKRKDEEGGDDIIIIESPEFVESLGGAWGQELKIKLHYINFTLHCIALALLSSREPSSSPPRRLTDKGP